jgi:hypothetical protein
MNHQEASTAVLRVLRRICAENQTLQLRMNSAEERLAHLEDAKAESQDKFDDLERLVLNKHGNPSVPKTKRSNKPKGSGQ